MALNPAWARARNILAIRLDSLGDVLMTAPALAALRATAPGARITLLTSSAGAQAGHRIDAVDEILVYAAPWMGAAPQAGAVPSDLAFIAQLAAHRFDAAIIFTVCTQSALPAALACRLAGIGLRLAHARENPYALLTDWVPDTDIHLATVRHEVQRQLDLVRHVGFETADERLHMRFGSDDAAGMRRALAAAGGQADQPYIVIHPGASAASRRYSPQHYGLAAQMLQARTGHQIIFTGSEDEADLVAQATAQMRQPPIQLAGRLELGELAALIHGARVLVCNNTGPAHMAAALDTPVVVLYALTNPQHTPWQVPARVLSHDVPCRNCLRSRCPQRHHDCLERITPEEVVAAVLELLAQPRDAGARAAPRPLPFLEQA